MGSSPVGPFVVAKRNFGGHPKRRTSLDCLAEMLAGTSVPSSTWATLPVHGVLSTWLTCQAPATTPAAMDLPALVKVFVERVASLSDVTPRTPALWVRLSRRPSFRSHRVCDSERFRGRERRSRPLPASVGCSQFGTASLSTHRQALTGLSWLSSSPRAIYARRRASHGPVPLVAKSEAPHAGHG